MTNIEKKPADQAEHLLIQGILSGKYPVNSALPGERQLAEILGITRPTLREALQRMARDGWLDIQQGKTTRVRDYLKEGSLGVLQSLIQMDSLLSKNFIVNVLEVRALLAPSYARLAAEIHNQHLIEILEEYKYLEDTAEDFTEFDAHLHRQLGELSENPIFSLILNGFIPLYPEMGKLYFSIHEARQSSRIFYENFLTLTKAQDFDGIEKLVDHVMQSSIHYWKNTKYPSDI